MNDVTIIQASQAPIFRKDELTEGTCGVRFEARSRCQVKRRSPGP